MDSRNLPYAYIEPMKGGRSLGTWLVTPWLDMFRRRRAGDFHGGRAVAPGDLRFRALLRTVRHHAARSDTRNLSRHGHSEKFSQPCAQSKIRSAARTREVDIYMNHPLRYAGLTFYQARWAATEVDQSRRTSTLQVVRNPGWLTPYAGCLHRGGRHVCAVSPSPDALPGKRVSEEARASGR